MADTNENFDFMLGDARIIYKSDLSIGWNPDGPVGFVWDGRFIEGCTGATGICGPTGEEPKTESKEEPKTASKEESKTESKEESKTESKEELKTVPTEVSNRPKARVLSLEIIDDQESEIFNNLKEVVAASQGKGDAIDCFMSGCTLHGFKPEFEAQASELNARNEEAREAHRVRMQPYRDAAVQVELLLQEVGGSANIYLPPAKLETIPRDWYIRHQYVRIRYLEGQTLDQFLVKHRLIERK